MCELFAGYWHVAAAVGAFIVALVLVRISRYGVYWFLLGIMPFFYFSVKIAASIALTMWLIGIALWLQDAYDTFSKEESNSEKSA